MLLATTTVATAIINAEGRFTHQLPRLARGLLHCSFEVRTTITPYAAWVSRWGLWPLWAVGAWIVGLAAWAAGRRAH